MAEEKKHFLIRTATKIKIVVIVLVVAAAVIMFLQNNDLVPVKLLLVDLQIPLSVLLICTLLLGFALGVTVAALLHRRGGKAKKPAE